MLKAITNWKSLSRALAGRGEAIYRCHECSHVWIGSAHNMPERCPMRSCRAWANAPRYASVGRPAAEKGKP